MQGYEASTYGDRFAEVYDDWYPGNFETGETVAGLLRLAGTGSILELGVGTGRLAIPIAAAGHDIWGLDASQRMLDRLAVKPGGGLVRPLLGDMGDPLPGGPYSLVFIAYNTFFNLLGSAAQQLAFHHVAAVLEPGGRFVMEAFVPAAGGRTGSAVEVKHLATDRVVLSVHRSDELHQTAEGSYVEFTETGGVRLRPWSIRFAHPAELDEMARNAGLALEARHAGWDDGPFDDSASHHVSVFRRPV